MASEMDRSVLLGDTPAGSLYAVSGDGPKAARRRGPPVVLSPQGETPPRAHPGSRLRAILKSCYLVITCFMIAHDFTDVNEIPTVPHKTCGRTIPIAPDLTPTAPPIEHLAGQGNSVQVWNRLTSGPAPPEHVPAVCLPHWRRLSCSSRSRAGSEPGPRLMPVLLTLKADRPRDSVARPTHAVERPWSKSQLTLDVYIGCACLLEMPSSNTPPSVLARWPNVTHNDGDY